jgi:hypothetical protein
MQRIDICPGVYTLADFLGPTECEEFVVRAERGAFESAPINSATGVRVETETRNNDRQIWDDFELAARLWERARLHVSEPIGERFPVGLNERFRLYRYAPGQRFKWHADAPYRRASGEISLLTFMVYLNEGYEGGATRFEAAKVMGKAGMALLFQHGLIHEGAEVTHGVKYVLRSDVMYGVQ